MDLDEYISTLTALVYVRMGVRSASLSLHSLQIQILSVDSIAILLYWNALLVQIATGAPRLAD